MKLKLISILTLALVAGAGAQTEMQKPIAVGVLRFAGPRKTMDNNVTALFDVNLSSDSRFDVVDRNELDKVMEEQALGKSGNITPDTAAKIGRLTGAKVLVDGRVFKTGSEDNIIVIASVIGTETGRIFSQTAQGSSTNLVALISGLSKKIAQTIEEQSTNLIASATNSPEEQLDKAIAKIKGKPQPTVSIKINGTDAAGQIAQNELGQVFQKAGFTVVDEKSDERPDILITGDAVVADDTEQGSLSSGHATLEIKAQEWTTGKILALDLQQGVAVDIGGQIAADMALKNATDKLAERLLPLLAK